MKKILCVAVMILFIFCMKNDVQASINVKMDVQYGQTNAREMEKMMNTFRTGKNAWAWTSNGKKKTYSNLKKVRYDYELEKVAMKRAAEIAVSFNHTRPNGKDPWSAYSKIYQNTYMGENIAAGILTAQDVFEMWKEDNEDYDGQGHRRNMLSSDFCSVGIGHAYYDGYDYWVQEFSSKIGSSKETKAKDFKTQVQIEISDKKIQKQNISVNKKQCEMFCGDLITLPVISSKIYVEDHWPQDYISVSEDDAWDIENENIAEIQEKRLFGKKEGETKILANAFGKNISVPITVHPAMKPAKSVQLFANVVYSTTNFIYNGQVQKPKVKEIVVKEGDRVLSNSTDYTYSLSDSKKPGVYGVKVQQNGEYGETVQSIQSYQIRPKERNLQIDAEKKGFHLKWNRDSLIAGYQICYSTEKDMRSKKIVKVTSNKVTQKRISNLKGKQKYYIQIRSYKNTNYNGEMYTIFSNWTKSKAVTTKG